MGAIRNKKRRSAHHTTAGESGHRSGAGMEIESCCHFFGGRQKTKTKDRKENHGPWTMVEILPYVDENEDQFTWIPLAHQGLEIDTTTKGHSISKSATATTRTTQRHEAASANADPNFYFRTSSPTNELLHSRQQQHAQSQSYVAVVSAENVREGEDNGNDTDDKWQELSPESSSRSKPGSDDASTPIIMQPWLWGDQLIAHITSPIHTKISDSTTSSTSRVVANDASSGNGEGDNHIVWRRPDELDDNGERRGNLNSMDRSHCNNEEENGNRKKITKMQSLTDTADASKTTRQNMAALPWAKDDGFHDNDRRWERPSQQQQDTNFRRSDQRTSDFDPTPRNDNSSSSSTVKSKLQQTLIHDPLRSLPYCFIRHFYQEMKHQIHFTWDTYQRQNDLHTILAPLSLVILVTLWGVALIANGCTGIVSFIIRSLVQVVWSFSVWLNEYSWTMANHLIWFSICATVFLGAIVWVGISVGRNRNKVNESDKHLAFQMPPSVSAIIPWIIAFTSPSFVEAIAIVLSLQMFVSVLAVENDEKECFALDSGEHDLLCSAAEIGRDQSSPSSFGVHNMILASVALIVAIVNIFVVSIGATALEQRRDQSKLERFVDENPNVKHSLSLESQDSTSALFRLRVNHNRIQQNISACHTISVFTLVFLTMTLVLIQTLCLHFRTNGSTFIMSLINRIGIVGFNGLCIGVGIFTLLHTWNFTMNKVPETDNVLANGISCGEISRRALKKSIVEISVHAVWSEEDTGSSLLGILSDDDGALRYAIFEWIVDRWTTSPAPSDESSHTAAQVNEENVGKDGTETSNSQFNAKHSSDSTKTSTSGNHQPILPSYQSLQKVIAKLDADETLIPTIERYREWVFTLPPSKNAAMCVAIWKLCPGISILIATVLFCIVRSSFRRLVTGFSLCFGKSFASSANEEGGCIIPIFAICTIVSPLIFLEYHRVQMWWSCITTYMNRMKSERQTSDAETNRNLSMTILRADPTFDTLQRSMNVNVFADTSDLLMRIWILLLESISILESSIPVVRCATIASAAADLTTNTICLVDLALEIKRRGILFGVGIMVWDAFTYHLSKEIEERKLDASSDDQTPAGQTEDREEFGGKYTGAVVSSVENIGKLSRNIGGLMDQKGTSDGSDNRTAKVETTITCDEVEQSTAVSEEKEQSEGSQDEPLLSFDNETQKNNPTGEERPMREPGGDDTSKNGLVPILVGALVAGLAVHAAAANKGSHKRKDSR